MRVSAFVRCLLHIVVICIYTNIGVLVHAFLVLVNGVQGVVIYGIALISCEFEEKASCYLSKSFISART
jgi:hypothetical protein